MKKISVFFRKDSISDEGYPVYLSISEHGKKVRINTGLHASEPFTGTIFPASNTDYIEKTLALAKQLDEIKKYISDFPDCSLNDVKSSLLSVKKVYNLVYYIRKVMQSKRESDRKLYADVVRLVENYDTEAGLDDVTPQWLDGFDNYMSRTRSVNSRSIIMTRLRVVMNYCVKNNITSNYPFKDYHIKTEDTPIKFLSLDQVRQLRDYPVEEWQEKYRDLFILQILLGGVNAVDIVTCKGLTNGRFMYQRTKTKQKSGTWINIPVVPEAQAIINKYRGKNYLLYFMDDYANYSDFLSRYNKGLKSIGQHRIIPDKVGKRRKIERTPLFSFISTYTARYTYVCLATELGIPLEHTGAVLGHTWAKKIVTARFYMAIQQQAIDSAIYKIADYIYADKKERQSSQTAPSE